MYTWRDYPLWLKDLAPSVPADLKTPYETALFEAEAYMRGRDARPEIRPQVRPQIRLETDASMGDSYEIVRGKTWTVRGGDTGILYGTYALLQDLSLGRPVRHGLRRSAMALRVLECWDNMDGSIERGYAGRSVWFEKDAFQYEPDRIRQLGRILASAGINVLCINNVNVHKPAQQLIGSMLEESAAFADLLRPFGVRLMVTADFSMPLREGLKTADPLDPGTADWWRKTAEQIYRAIPDFAGFLVKADSEHRPGPNTYGRTHAEGANMLAEALAPFGGVVIWRAFVYNCMQDWRDTGTDRPCAAYEAYRPLDGAFAENVILQVKYGPFDFQVREPVSPLLLGMERTDLAVELQLAQEYTGQQIDLFAMPAMWREIFDGIGPERVGRMRAVAAVSNLGRDANWTGHPFAALNLFAFGRFAWDPEAEPEEVIREWTGLTYDMEEADREKLLDVLLRSRGAYEKYTSTLGLCWMMVPETHYGPSPWGYEFQVWGTYNRADREAVGIDRTGKGTGLTMQYPPELREKYEDPGTCPEELLLFFHRLPYTYRMRDGRTLIQRIYDDHFEGAEEAQRLKESLEMLPLPERDIDTVRERMALQVKNAAEWRDVVNTFFCRLSGIEDEKGRKFYAV